MGLDESEDDPLVRLDVRLVHPDGAAVLGLAGGRERRGVLGDVVHEAILFRDFPADHLLELGGRVGPVRARAVDDCKVRRRHVGKLREEPREEAIGGERPRDVGDHDRDPILRPDGLPERFAADRMPDRHGEGRRLVGHALDEARLDDRDVGCVGREVNPARPVLKADAFHSGYDT